ncbi:mechanosensitive ion channel family protein [Sphingomonas morindae]|uniref:Mechanosensitive ion channel family protein n=1 Tax=Sphingomonas morindae TaxID=1541170 RepID=A0ABY4XBF5_9SPHN|nr:mechanosensitive ion channel domain-containing protein [Sphingomonas morindae]USI74030.1 mechanosensitive ion channel family protein [Sphingomonas morindae]
MFLLRRAAARTASQSDDIVIARFRNPTRWLFALIGLSIVKPFMDLGPQGNGWWSFLAGLTAPAVTGWMLATALSAANEIVQLRTDISVADNLLARRRRTRVGILYRIGLFLVLIGTLCLMLMSIPAVRAVGVTLAASAGIGALAVGAAAQPALKNVIAGIQMAFTEPIRIDDVVIVDGEWGRIEEIRLTYVVINIWDQRRLVVPVSKFLEENFQNWTRSSSELLGTAFLHVDRTADVPRLRAKLTEIVSADPLWDGRVCGLQVTDSFPTYLELRCLVSAANAGRAFDLRCNVREAMTAFIARDMPEALPRTRELVTLQPASEPAGTSSSSSSGSASSSV